MSEGQILSEGQLMLAAGMMMLEAAKVNAQVFAMRSHDDWEMKFGKGNIYLEEAYESASAYCSDPQHFMRVASQW